MLPQFLGNFILSNISTSIPKKGTKNGATHCCQLFLYKCKNMQLYYYNYHTTIKTAQNVNVTFQPYYDLSSLI